MNQCKTCENRDGNGCMVLFPPVKPDAKGRCNSYEPSIESSTSELDVNTTRNCKPAHGGEKMRKR